LAVRIARWRGQVVPGHDVVFYVPSVGSLVSLHRAAPAGGAEVQALLLAKALAQRGLRVAMIAYGSPEDLPSKVDGIRIVPRPPYRKRGPLVGKVAETYLIWRALWQVPSSTIVTRCAGVQVGLIAAFARLFRRQF